MSRSVASSDAIPSPPPERSLSEFLKLMEDGGWSEEALAAIVRLGPYRYCRTMEEAVLSDVDHCTGATGGPTAVADDAVVALGALLRNADANVRYCATVMLGQIGSRRSVLPLCGALGDPEPAVRHAAARVLGKIGDLRAVYPLRELLRGDRHDRRHATAALERLIAPST